MKKSLFFVFLFCIAAMQAFAADWEEVTPPPCENTYPWNGPYTKQVCQEDYPELQCAGCCFTVVYHERFIQTQGSDREQYEVHISGIYFTGETENCRDCIMEDVIEKFMDKLFNENVTDPKYNPSFLERVLDDLLSPNRQYEDFYANAKCVLNDEECDPSTVRCCQQECDVDYIDENGDGYADGIGDVELTSYEYVEPPCPVNCYPVCKAIPFQELGSIICDIPCNKGLWDEKQSDPIDMSALGCPGCFIIIHYRDRQTPEECDPQYVDIEMLNLEMVGCEYCNLTETQLHSFAIDWLLKYSDKIQSLQPGRCYNSLRVLTKSCWRMTSDNEAMIPCNVPDCCWAIYMICRDQTTGEITRTLIETGSTTTAPDCSPTQACELVCGAFPNPKNPAEYEREAYSGETDSYAVPNPSSGNVDIHLNSELNGNIIISVFNHAGEKMLQKAMDKNSGRVDIPVDASSLPSGMYMYKINLDGNIISSGFFTIIK